MLLAINPPFDYYLRYIGSYGLVIRRRLLLMSKLRMMDLWCRSWFESLIRHIKNNRCIWRRLLRKKGYYFDVMWFNWLILRITWLNPHCSDEETLKSVSDVCWPRWFLGNGQHSWRKSQRNESKNKPAKKARATYLNSMVFSHIFIRPRYFLRRTFCHSLLSFVEAYRTPRAVQKVK